MQTGLKRFWPLVLLIMPALLRAEERWLRVETPHFRVLARGGEPAARRTAAELEQVRRGWLAVSGPPAKERTVTAVVFSSRDEFEPFWPLFESLAQSVPGYSISGPQRSYVLLVADSDRQTLLLHEYAHVFFQQRYSHLPVWLDEGLAEFFAATRATERVMSLGEVHARYLPQLRKEKLLPLNVFFSVNKESPLYGDRSGPSLFYAQAWATAHFLLLGEATPQFAKLDALVRALNASAPAAKAIEQAFGVPAEQLERELESYVRRPLWPRLRVGLSAAGASDPTVRPATRAEMAFHFADIFAQSLRYDEARARLQQALTRDPDSAPFHELLGWMALWEKDHAKAEEHFARAIAARSEDTEVYFLRASLALERRDKGDGQSRPTPETLAAIREDLRGAIARNPSHARAHGLLGFTLLITRVETDEAIGELQRAIELEPSNPAYRIHLAQAYLQKEDWAAARRVLEEARAAAVEPGPRTSIEQMLHYVESLPSRR